MVEEGKKFDSGKLRYDLLPVEPLGRLVEVYTKGAAKYGDRNWEKGLAFGRVFAAIQRHLWAWKAGADFNQEDELYHLAQAAWGCLALLEYQKTHPEMDDRERTSNL